MEREQKIYQGITLEDVRDAAYRAFKDHDGEAIVLRFARKFDYNCERIYKSIKNHTYHQDLWYRQLTKINNNGKVRNIDSPSLKTRIFQYIFLNKFEPLYYKRDNHNGKNCKPRCGITASTKHLSVLKTLKHVYYDRRDLNYAIVIDQRSCYAHVKPSVFKNALKEFIDDTQFIDFAVDVCFVNDKLPIGTPTSPMVHHIIMYRFDELAKSISGASIRYADDNILFFATKEEAQAAKWRIKNYWWYELQMRAKRQTVRVVPLTVPLDFCGYVLHRNANKDIADHNKGFTTLRQSTIDRAKKCSSDDAWGSYFGLLRHADSYNLMLKIEQSMKLKELTNKVKIDRELDAPNIKMDDLVGRVFTIYDYDLRKDPKGVVNWVKCLIGIPQVDENGKCLGKPKAYEFHGSYQYLSTFLEMCEKQFGGKGELLPIEEAKILSSSGYIFEDSTNMIEEIG